MATIRVTQGLLVRRTLNNLNHQLRSLSRLQEQLATGLKVNTPSDDPIAMRRAVNIRTTMQKNEQYVTNIESVASQLDETEGSTETVLAALQRAKELAVQGANGANSQQQLDSIASEINQLLEEVLIHSNHATNGRYVFGGTCTKSPPFVATRDADGNITAVSYEGNDERIQVAIADGVSVNASEPGSAVFFSQQDTFQVLINIRDSLTAGDQAAIQNELLGDLDESMDQMLVSMARVGAIQNRLERTSSDLEDFAVQLEIDLSNTIDADYAETIMNLNAQSNAYQAALNAGARVIQPSLLDYVG